MALTVLNGPNIEAGESLSDALDCSAGRIVKITMPAEWTHADLTFQTSSDGWGFNDLFNSDGTEVVFFVRPGTGIFLAVPMNIGWIKLRSGYSNSPLPQEERREFAVAIEAAGGAAVTEVTKVKRSK